jgi:hemerythrin-like domain-containing protein
VKRHAALIPLSHDHHHGLSEARRLRKASNEDDGTREASVERFLRFYRDETVDHFRLEEERLLPLLTDCDGPAETLVTRTLLEHQHIRATVTRLEAPRTAADADPSLMRQVADLLEHHIRFEERQLFPYLERTIPSATLDSLGLQAARLRPPPPSR